MASHPALDVRFPAGPGAGALEDLLYAELDDFEPTAIQDLAGGGWRVFFRTAKHRDAALAALSGSLGRQALTLTPADVDDEDWARRSQAALTPVRVGRLIVAPPWAIPEPGNTEPGTPEPIAIIIEPSTGFGTGHHATTRMCLDLLQQIDLRGSRVIDIGTGSGLLAIAAWKLGAGSVVALDNDPSALDNARANLQRNHDDGRVEIVEGDVERISLPPGDVVLANLTGPMLERCSPSLMALARPKATAILSGFAPEDRHGIASAWMGWSVLDRRQDGEWSAVALVSRG